jgi:hypothetical protein
VPHQEFFLQRNRITSGQLGQLRDGDRSAPTQCVERKSDISAELLDRICAVSGRESWDQGGCRLESDMRDRQRKPGKDHTGNSLEALSQTRLPESIEEQGFPELTINYSVE